MSVVIETTLGDITVDLYLNERPRACLNFIKLCKLKYYNFNLFHTISRGFIAQTGDPTGSRSGGSSLYGVLDGPDKRYFEAENEPRIKHTKMGLISFVGNEERMIGSQFFFTLGEDLTYLDQKHCVFGEVVEGMDVLEEINEVICDTDDCPYQDVRITHTVILNDPYPDPKRLIAPSRSPSPSAERLQGGRIAPDEDIDETEGKTAQEVAELQAEREAKARATILEMVGDLPDAEMAPPENVLFICKLNPVTTDDDLEIIFNRFGKIVSCEVIRDRKTGDSLQYAFIEFAERKSCEDAYFKMDNILIDDRRIHVDFSQSVSKVKWLGKGRGVTHFDEKGRKTNQYDTDIGKGNYKVKKRERSKSSPPSKEDRPRREKENRSSSHKNSSKSTSNRYREKRDRSRTPTRYSNKENSSQRYRENSYQFSRRYEDRTQRKGNNRDRRRRSRSQSLTKTVNNRRYQDRDRERDRYRDRNRHSYRSRDDVHTKKELSRRETSNRKRSVSRSPHRSSKNGSARQKESIRNSRPETKEVSKKIGKKKSESSESSSDTSSDDDKRKKKIKPKDKRNSDSRKKKKVQSSESESTSDSETDSSESQSDKRKKLKRKNSNQTGKKKTRTKESSESSSSDSSDSSETESSEDDKRKKSKKRKKTSKSSSSDSESQSDSSDADRDKNKKKKKNKR